VLFSDINKFESLYEKAWTHIPLLQGGETA
jgi:hypothetical protein